MYISLVSLYKQHSGRLQELAKKIVISASHSYNVTYDLSNSTYFAKENVKYDYLKPHFLENPWKRDIFDVLTWFAFLYWSPYSRS